MLSLLKYLRFLAVESDFGVHKMLMLGGKPTSVAQTKQVPLPAMNNCQGYWDFFCLFSCREIILLICIFILLYSLYFIYIYLYLFIFTLYFIFQIILFHFIF